MLPRLANTAQNRELQIMRIVRHPNIVELKAFFYNNGERVCVCRQAIRAFRVANRFSHRRTKSTSTSCSNSFPRPSTAHPATSTR